MAVTRKSYVITMTAASDEIATPLRGTLRWVSKGATAGDDILVVQSSANGGDGSSTVWESMAAGANYKEESLPGQYYPHGIKVSVIDSGTLYFYEQG